MTATEATNQEAKIELPPKVKGNTCVHSLPAKSFLKILLLKDGMTAMIVCGVILVAGILLGILVNYYILIAALMFLFVVIPGVMMFLYFSNSLRSLTILNTTPHILTLTQDGAEILLAETGRKIALSRNELAGYYVYGDAVIITSRDKKAGWLWLPLSAFDDQDEMRWFLNELTGNKNGNNPGQEEKI